MKQHLFFAVLCSFSLVCFSAIKEEHITSLIDNGITKPYGIALCFYTCKTDDDKALLDVITKTKQTLDTLKPHIDFLKAEIQKADNKEQVPTLNQLLHIAGENLSLLHQLNDLFWCKNPGTFWNLLKLKSIVTPPLGRLHLVEKKLDDVIKDTRSQTLTTALQTTKASTTTLRTTVGNNITSKAMEFRKKLKLIGTVRKQA